jgi:hypothetical protein
VTTKKPETHPDELLEAAVLVAATAPVLVGVVVENEVIVKVCGAPVEVTMGVVEDVVDIDVSEVEEVVVVEDGVEDVVAEVVLVEVVGVVVGVVVVVGGVVVGEEVVVVVVGGAGGLVGRLRCNSVNRCRV